MIFRVLVFGITVIAFSLFVVPAASAHNTIPRVEISMERLHPGEVINLRGVSFEMDITVTLTLLGPGVEIPLGEILSNGEGEFTHIAVLPADLAEGAYFFRAVTSHHYVLSPPLTVWGTAVTEGGGQGPRDHDDALLAPMPTFAPAVATEPASQVAEPPPASNSNLIITAVVSLIIILIAVGLGIKRKSNP